MNIEEKVKANLLVRGFDNKTQLNNRGLIEATIDETILEVVKNLRIADVMAMLPTENQLDEIAFRKYGNDPEGEIKFNLVKRMAFVEGCEFMLGLLKGN